MVLIRLALLLAGLLALAAGCGGGADRSDGSPTVATGASTATPTPTPTSTSGPAASPSPPATGTPADGGAPPVGAPRNVTLTTEDGLTLEGILYGADGATKGIVLSHMFPGTMEDWAPFAAKLAGHGYLALVYNFRGYGASDGPKEIAKLDRDVRAAVALLRSQGATEVYLVGASMGGTASLVAAAGGVPVVAGIVSISSPESFDGLDAGAVAGQITVPALFIASEEDDGAPQSARSLAAKTGSNTVTLFPGDRHGTDLLTGPDAGAVEGLILGFLDR